MNMPAEWTEELFSGVDWSELCLPSSQQGCSEQAVVVKRWLDLEQIQARKAALRMLWALLSLSVHDLDVNQCSCVHRLPRDALIVLVQLLERIESRTVRTRIVDAAWSHGRACSAKVVEQCVREYLALAQSTYEQDQWVTSLSYLKRAFAVASSLGRKHVAYTETSTVAVDTLHRVSVAESGYFTLRLVDVLLERKIGDPAQIAAILLRVADGAEAAGDLARSRDYLERAASCFHGAQKPDQRHQVLRKLAEVLERDALSFRAQPDGMMHAAMLLEQAVTVYRSVPGGGAEVDRLKPELQRVRAEVAAAMPRLQLATFDSRELTELARARVKGRPARDALVGLITLLEPIEVAELREAAAAALHESPLASAFSSLNLKKSGQVVHRATGTLDPNDEDAATDRMHAHLNLFRQINAFGIDAARAQLQLEHGFAEVDFCYLATRSSFVPRGREPLFARGLAFGAAADYVSAAHLLIPQLEHALRVHLNAIEVSTLTLPNSGVQDERDLGFLLQRPELAKVLHDAVIFDWRSLLTDKAGANLRNELAHGLIEPGDRLPEYVYLWWTVLRCVIAPGLVWARAVSEEGGQQQPSVNPELDEGPTG